MGARGRRRASIGIGLGFAASLFVPTVAGAAAAPQSPGITSKTVTVGQIDDLTKPIPGLFKSAEDGTKAYFDYLNAHGGVDGRKVVLDVRDSQNDGGIVASETKSIAQNDFAMVGGYSLLDGAEQSGIDAAKLPDVTYPLSVPLSNDPNVYSPSPATSNDVPTGPFLWAKHTWPKQSKHIGILYDGGSGESITSNNIITSAMRSSGLHVQYQRGYAGVVTGFSPDVLKMKSQGVQMYYMYGLPGIYASILARETALQNYHPIHIEGIAAYVSNMNQASGGTANGMYLEQQAALYEGADAKVIPEVALFDKWVLRVDPKVFSSVTPLPALDGWASGMLFAQALKAAGPNPTRAGLMAQLDKVTSFDAHGLLPPGENPAKNIPSRCFLVARLENGKWARVRPTPKKGFICTGTLRRSPHWKPQTR